MASLGGVISPQVSAPPRPLLRGWLHTITFPITVIAGVVLVATAPTTSAKVSSAIFVATAALLFGVSALLHRGHWTPRVESVLRRLDHADIYLIIAGTYTPIAVLALPPNQARLMLAIVWTGAIAGVFFRVFWITAPRWLSTTMYVVTGWVAILFVNPLIDGAGLAAFILIVVGGVLYSVGAVIYATKRPDLVPGVFGFHELFHALTVAAFVCHYIAIWIVVHQQ
ncbi:MAG: hemolysin III family protein [Armatimonadetes bacterium]|nr:MAG: hemolysin III family protein [Armatimonadota bacterium]